jgi:DNA-directed RNA polymerase omega subunit
MASSTDDKLNSTFVNPENKYLSVLAASKRARQLLDKAEKHNLTVDTEKVILQALTEFREGKVQFTVSDVPTKKKKDKDKEKE